MLAAFFPNYSPEYIEEKISEYHIYNHVDLNLDLDLKRFFFLVKKLSKHLDDREKAEKKQMEELQKLMGR